MQRVEDFSELFRLKQSRQKTRKAKQAMKRSRVLTHLLAPFIYKQIPVIVRRKATKKKNQIVNRTHPISPYTGGPAARQ